MAYGSEEFNALGGLKRSLISGDDEYLRQLNNITNQTVDSINRSGDAVARSNQNKWDSINQGITNGLNTYRDVTKENRANERQEKLDTIASEERERTHGERERQEGREDTRLGIDKDMAELKSREITGQLQDSEEARNWKNAQAVDAKGNPLLGPDGAPITNAQQERIMAQRTQQGQLDANASNIASQNTQRALVEYDMAKAKAGDERARASAMLYGPMSSGDQNAIAQVRQSLLNKGMSEPDVAQTLQETQAKIAASADQKQAKLWISPEFEPVKDTLKDFDKRAQGLKLLADEKSKYDASKGKLGFTEGAEGQDAKSRVAQIRREYFGDTKSADELEGRWFKGTAGDDMQKYIDMQAAVLNNQFAAKRPELAKYSAREPYVANMMQSIESGLKYKPTLAQDVNPTRPIFSIMPAASGPASNQQFMQQAAAGGPPPPLPNAAQPQMGGQAIQVGMPGQATQGAPQMPPQEHPLYKYRKK